MLSSSIVLYLLSRKVPLEDIGYAYIFEAKDSTQRWPFSNSQMVSASLISSFAFIEESSHGLPCPIQWRKHTEDVPWVLSIQKIQEFVSLCF
jgi:hypothetical protein